MTTVRVTSLNVGKPKEVDWKGRRVRTGAWKSPVSGRRRVTRLNIEGDGQGDLDGHGGPNRAVLVYQEEAYAFWRNQLARPDLSAGSFGDNVTIDGFPDDEVCIGDRFRIGTAQFEVSQPRVTCFRVGMRNQEPRLASLMVAHGRPGFYLRVLAEGEIAAGDAVELISRDSVGLTVAETNALLYLPDPDSARIAVVGAHPALSQGWRDSFTSMLAEPADAPPARPAWKGFRPLQIARIRRETPSVSSFYLTDPAGVGLPPARAGQYLTVRVRPTGAEGGVIRNYSLSAPTGGSVYRISVKRELGGQASNLLHDTFTEGQVLEVAVPRGAFVLQPRATAVVLASAGIGITPLIPMLAELLETNPHARVWWLHSTRTLEEYALLAEVEEMVAGARNVRLDTWVTRAGTDLPSQPRATARLHRGRMTAQALADLRLPVDAHAYLCGPPAFIDDVTAALTTVGLEPGSIASELFGAGAGLNPGVVSTGSRPAPHPPDRPGSGPPVTFARSQLQVPWDAEYRSLLELAEACDVPTRWVCRTGVCHTCLTPLVSGEVAYVEEPLVAPEEATALICCSVPRSEVVLDL